MKYILTFILSIFTYFALSQDKVVSYSYVTFDNAYQNSMRQYVGYDKNFVIKNKDTTKEDHILDVTPLVGWRCYFYNGMENNFVDYRVNTNFKYNKNWCVNTNVSFLSSKEWSPVFFDGFVRRNKNRYSTEFFIERESVGTPIANQLRLVSTSAGLSTDFKISRRLTIVNSLAYNNISDGNSRWFHVSRLIHTLNSTSYVDFKMRRMIGGDWSPYYFSPNQIYQYNVGYGFNKSIKGVGAKFYFGTGLQRIDNYNMLMMNYDLRLNRTFNEKWYGELSTSSRNFNEYIYNTVNVRVIYTIGK